MWQQRQSMSIWCWFEDGRPWRNSLPCPCLSILTPTARPAAISRFFVLSVQTERPIKSVIYLEPAVIWPGTHNCSSSSLSETMQNLLSWSEHGTVNCEVVCSIPAKTQNRELKSTWIWATKTLKQGYQIAFTSNKSNHQSMESYSVRVQVWQVFRYEVHCQHVGNIVGPSLLE